MSIEKVNLAGYNLVKCENTQNSKPITPRKSEVIYTAKQDKEKSNAAKWMIGASALAGIAALVVAGRNGHLGENVQKLLRGNADNVASAAKKEVSETERIVSNTENKGMFGKDIYDPLDPLNEDDILSPYYKQKGMFGQDIYDPLNRLNEDDILSPYYKQKGMFGQDIYDPFDPLNKQDITSPYYET